LDAKFGAGQISGEDYFTAMSELAPDAIVEARRRTGLNKRTDLPEGWVDLDESPPQLDEQQQGYIGAVVALERAGQLEPGTPAAEADDESTMQELP